MMLFDLAIWVRVDSIQLLLYYYFWNDEAYGRCRDVRC
jgi:hypothetical protein